MGAKGTSIKKETGLKRCIQIFDSTTNAQFQNVFQYNLMKGAIEYAKTPIWREDKFGGDEINNLDESSIRAHLCRNFGFNPQKADVRDVIIEKAIKNPVHPIRDYLESLKWDGYERLSAWLRLVSNCDDNAYTRAVSRKFIIAAVKRIMEPGCKFDYMVVLEGAQGIFKSELLKILGGEYFAALSIEVKDQALMENMCGKWFIEFDEMSGWGKQDVERIKSLLTRTIDRRRPPYGIQSADFKRQCILAGTINPKMVNQYLNDETGNRRFWPIECKTDRINIEYVKENRDQIFAEAFQAYKNGEPIWLTDEEESQIAIAAQDDRQRTDSWKEIIYERLRGERRPKVYISQILTEYLQMRPERINHSYETRVGIIMSKIKDWRKSRDWDGDREYFYERSNESTNESEVDF